MLSLLVITAGTVLWAPSYRSTNRQNSKIILSQTGMEFTDNWLPSGWKIMQINSWGRVIVYWPLVDGMANAFITWWGISWYVSMIFLTGNYYNTWDIDVQLSAFAGGLIYKWTRSMSGGDYPTPINTGDFYKISEAGTGDGIHFAVGDMIVANKKKTWTIYSSDMDKIDNVQNPEIDPIFMANSGNWFLWLSNGLVPYRSGGLFYDTNIYAQNNGISIWDPAPYYTWSTLNVSGWAIFYNPTYSQVGWFLLDILGKRVWLYGAIIWVSTGTSVYGQTDIWHAGYFESTNIGTWLYVKSTSWLWAYIRWSGTALQVAGNIVISGNIFASNIVTGFTRSWDNTNVPTTKATVDYIDSLIYDLGNILTTWAIIRSWEAVLPTCYDGQRTQGISWGNLRTFRCTGSAWLDVGWRTHP